jgi:hypothetical protein
LLALPFFCDQTRGFLIGNISRIPGFAKKCASLFRVALPKGIRDPRQDARSQLLIRETPAVKINEKKEKRWGPCCFLPGQ